MSKNYGDICDEFVEKKSKFYVEYYDYDSMSLRELDASSWDDIPNALKSYMRNSKVDSDSQIVYEIKEERTIDTSAIVKELEEEKLTEKEKKVREQKLETFYKLKEELGL